MSKLKRILLTAFIVITYTVCGQTTATLNTLDSSYQSCLDKGFNMSCCSVHYYNQMDSMLNIVYKKLRNEKDSTGKGILRSRQLKWLWVRNKYFKQLNSELSDNLRGNDKTMIAIEKKALYVKERVIELMKESQHIKTSK